MQVCFKHQGCWPPSLPPQLEMRLVSEDTAAAAHLVEGVSHVRVSVGVGRPVVEAELLLGLPGPLPLVEFSEATPLQTTRHTRVT